MTRSAAFNKSFIYGLGSYLRYNPAGHVNDLDEFYIFDNGGGYSLDFPLTAISPVIYIRKPEC
jgi:hypothetical protein